MNEIIEVNVNSIKVIHPELNVTMQQASRCFESFVSDHGAHEALGESTTALQEVIGVLKLIDVPGVLALAQSMERLLQRLAEAPDQASHFSLSALSHGFVALPCYLEYLIDREQTVPILLLPFINELKAALKEPLLLESEFVGYQKPLAVLAGDGASSDADVQETAKRFRQMFQLGLIGLLREENMELKMQLMHRALSRMAASLQGSNERTVFRLGEAVFEGLLTGKLALNFTRKRTISALDGAFKQAACGEAVSIEEAKQTELLFLVNRFFNDFEASREVIEKHSLTQLSLTDVDLQREKAVMQGPNADTIITMVTALREELAQSKEVLEIAAQDPTGNMDFSNLVSLFQRTSDILSVVGLTTPGQILADLRAQANKWVEGEPYGRDSLLFVADGLIYVESVLQNLSRMDLNFEEMNMDDQSKHQLMARSQLSEAQRIVITEAQAGIAEAKKDINSFVESNYDMVHLSPVVECLTSVQGGLQILNLDAAAAVLASCVRFLQAVNNDGLDSAKAADVIETMADALIALEYFLSEYEIHGVVPDKVLQVAEQSLTALGYPVQ